MRAAERARHGFTLLEVLAAVALLGIAYTVLGGAGIQGLQHEGEAERRFRATLLADRVLEGLESGFDLGAAPPLGDDERSEGDFVVTVRVAPFEVVVPERERPRGLSRAEDRARGLGEARRDGPDLGPGLLAGEGGQPAPLRRVEVVVRWQEGWGEREVRRTTFGLDATAAAEAIASLSAAAEAAATGQRANPAATEGGGSGLGGRPGDGDALPPETRRRPGAR